VFVPQAKVADGFVPGVILVAPGAENKTDKLKPWAEDVALGEERSSDDVAIVSVVAGLRQLTE